MSINNWEDDQVYGFLPDGNRYGYYRREDGLLYIIDRVKGVYCSCDGETNQPCIYYRRKYDLDPTFDNVVCQLDIGSGKVAEHPYTTSELDTKKGKINYAQSKMHKPLLLRPLRYAGVNPANGAANIKNIPRGFNGRRSQ